MLDVESTGRLLGLAENIDSSDLHERLRQKTAGTIPE